MANNLDNNEEYDVSGPAPWANEVNVVDAGVRQGSVVSKASPSPRFQDAVVAQTEENVTATIPYSFQDAVEQAYTSQERAGWQLGTGSENTDRYAGSVLGTVEALNSGDDVYNTIEKSINDVSANPDAQGYVREQITKDTEAELRAALESQAAVSADNVQGLIDTYKQLNAWNLTVNSSAGFEAYTAQQLNTLAAIQSEQGNSLLQEWYFRQYGEASVAKFWDAQSLPDKFWDFAKIAVGISGTVGMAKFTEKFDTGYFGSTVNTLGETVGRISDLKLTGKGYDAYKATYTKFWGLPASERVLLFDQIEQHVRDITADNSFVYLGMIMPFVDRSSVKDVGFDYLIDSLTVLGVASKPVRAIMKFQAATRASRKPISLLIKSGNMEKAAALINKALADNADRMRRITGQSKSEMAMNSSPIDMSTVVTGQIQGAAAEAQKQLEKDILNGMGVIDQAYVKTTDPSQTPVRIYYDDTAKSARQREVLGDLGDDVHHASIVESGDTGFTVEVNRLFNPETVFDRQSIEASLATQKLKVEEAKQQLEAIRSTMSDLKFADDADAVKLRKTLSANKEKVRRLERQLTKLEKQMTSGAPEEGKKVRVNYGYDEAGRLTVEELQTATLPKVASPSQVVDQLYPGLSDEATMRELNADSILKSLRNASEQVLRGLTSKEKDNVNKILLWGDEQGRVFDVNELYGSGITTKWGKIRFTSTREAAAYYAQRRAFDHIHRMENYIKARDLQNAGTQELVTKIKMPDGSKYKAYVKIDPVDPTTNTRQPRKKIPEGISRIYDHQAGAGVDVRGIDNLDRRLAGEWSIVQFRTPVRIGDELLNYGLVRLDKDLGNVKGQVMGYRPGYVPRVRADVRYVASKAGKKMIDGRSSDWRETVRFFKNRNDADNWRMQQPDFADIEILPGREYRSSMYPNLYDEFDDINFGGLYQGTRTDRAILMGVDGSEAHRVSAYKSLSDNINHIARRFSINELRMNMIGRFQNTYGDYLQNPADWRSPLKPEAANDLNLSKSVEAMRGYINSYIGQPTKFEEWWSDRMRAMAEAMDRNAPMFKTKVGDKSRDFFMNAAASDPVSALRAATFHIMLGFYDVSQILVQALGSSIAISAYPGRAVKLLPKNFALTTAWALRKNKKALGDVAKAAGADASELDTIIKEIEYAKLFDSLRSSADFAAASEGIGTSADAVRRFIESGTKMVRGGEMWTRGYGYLLARDLYLSERRAFGSKKALSKDEIMEVAKRSLRFTLNLNRSNRAYWQNGVLSIPTQFWQVLAKFSENMIAGSFGYGVRKWTPAEKTKIMVGHMAMFGAAGVPFGHSMVKNLMQLKAESTDDQKMITVDKINPFNNLPPDLRVSDEAFLRFVNGGVLQTIAALTGADPNLASRLSIPAGIEETMDLYASGQKGLLDLIGGAMLPGMSRIFDTATGLYEVFGPTFASDIELSDDELRQAVLEVAQIASSTRRATKAYLWNEWGRVTDGKGRTLYTSLEDEGFDSTLVWQTLGFAPSQVGLLYDLEDETDNLENRVTERLDMTKELIRRYGNLHDADYIDTPQKRNNFNKRIQLITAGLSQAEYEAYYNGLKKYIYDDKSRITEAVEKAITAASKAGSAGSSIATNPLVLPESPQE